MTEAQFLKAEAIRRDIATIEFLIERVEKSLRCELEIDGYHRGSIEKEMEKMLAEDERMAIEFHKQEIKRIIMEQLSELLEEGKKAFEAL